MNSLLDQELIAKKRSNLPDILYCIFICLLILIIPICSIYLGGKFQACEVLAVLFLIRLSEYIIPISVVWFSLSIFMVIRAFKIKEESGSKWRTIIYTVLLVVTAILSVPVLYASLIISALSSPNFH